MKTLVLALTAAAVPWPFRTGAGRRPRARCHDRDGQPRAGFQLTSPPSLLAALRLAPAPPLLAGLRPLLAPWPSRDRLRLIRVSIKSQGKLMAPRKKRG